MKTYDITFTIRVSGVENHEEAASIAERYAHMSTSYRSINAESFEVNVVKEVQKDQ